MTNYNDGEIQIWKGGECPVHPKTTVAVWKRGGGKVGDVSAGALEWRHDLSPYGIIAFQVVKEYREPKTIWVNEYRKEGHEAYAGHASEAEARECATPKAIRVAVKYQEVIE